ncbi:MAG: PhoU domain-containing protein [Candidatus Bathyarchaeia archaeon]
MEQRKIMSLGRSSLVISLPKHWTELNGLKQGDTVSLTINRDRSLAVYPGLGRKREDQRITLTIGQDEKESILTQSIVACYLNGFYGIRLVSKNIFSVNQLRAIRNIVRALYMRIMQSDAKQIYIEALIDESKVQVESSINRTYLVSSSMCRDAFIALRNRDINLAKAVYALNEDVVHFAYLLLRLLRSAAIDPSLANQLGLDPFDCLDFQTLVHRIQQVADQASNVARHVIMLGESHHISAKVLDSMYTAGCHALSMYDKAVKALSSRDISSCSEIIALHSQADKLDQEIAILAFEEEKDTEVICASCSIRDSIRRIVDYAVDICQIMFNQAHKPAF